MKRTRIDEVDLHTNNESTLSLKKAKTDTTIKDSQEFINEVIVVDDEDSNGGSVSTPLTSCTSLIPTGDFHKDTGLCTMTYDSET
jgi:hypothetical protein